VLKLLDSLIARLRLNEDETIDPSCPKHFVVNVFLPKRTGGDIDTKVIGCRTEITQHLGYKHREERVTLEIARVSLENETDQECSLLPQRPRPNVRLVVGLFHSRKDLLADMLFDACVFGQHSRHGGLADSSNLC
jgi:hypothetical protein